MPFGPADRQAHLEALRTGELDVLIVGGGVTGAGAARDAALRGLRVALVERSDYASGTSSRSSKLVHGGLRYLEQGDVGLVFEAVRERQRLMTLAPHLAHPLPFIVPVFDDSRHSVLVLDIGLTIYDMLAAGSGVIRHRAMRRKGLLACEPLLQSARLRGGVRYFDAMTNDCRLVLANVRDAVAHGATVVSRVSWVGTEIDERGPAGRLASVRLRDHRTDTEFEVRPKVVIMATGAWTDETRAAWAGAPPERPMMRPSKGVHIVVPRKRLPLAQAVMMTAADGRVVFALPWRHATVIGTTDTAYHGDLAHPRTTTDDADYLLATANSHFEPAGGDLAREDVLSSWAGIRPLAIGTRDDGENTYNTSREHVVQSDGRGLVIVTGGKLTTFRVMAAEAVDAAAAMLPADRVAAMRPQSTAKRPLPGALDLPEDRRPLEALARELIAAGCAGGLAETLVERYGDDARAIVAHIATHPDDAQQIVRGVPVVWAEAVWAIQHEQPLDLEDLCVRRLPIYYLAGERLGDAAEALADRFIAEAGGGASDRAALIAGLHAAIDEGRLAPPEADGAVAAADAAVECEGAPADAAAASPADAREAA